jgi:RNA-binding protein
MELLGIVEEITTDGKLIIKGKTLPDIGDPVFDQRERAVGTVKRIFGPVDEPYITVTVDDKAIAQGQKNKALYFKKGTQHGKGKRRNRGD